MDALAEQTQKAKVLHEKLKNPKSDVARLQEEKLYIKSRNSATHQRLLRIGETRSPPFNDTVCLALSEKLKHVFSLLNQIHGVLGSGVSSKQGGDEEVNVKEDFDQQSNEASGSRKDKGKTISEEEDE
ncbi:unnamed protein product [Lactuca virosa]|uniref:Uncharacterized protein n=1 Tax=Lactuca virosa TaxID=75947 RepID=A0AAU9MPG2_9ASTR|nr:unnamed protein product [Lactuca virosa]